MLQQHVVQIVCSASARNLPEHPRQNQYADNGILQVFDGADFLRYTEEIKTCVRRIFPSHEVFMLANVPVRDTEKELNITRDQVYAKYADELLIEKS